MSAATNSSSRPAGRSSSRGRTRSASPSGRRRRRRRTRCSFAASIAWFVSARAAECVARPDRTRRSSGREAPTRSDACPLGRVRASGPGWHVPFPPRHSRDSRQRARQHPTPGFEGGRRRRPTAPAPTSAIHTSRAGSLGSKDTRTRE